MTLSLRARLTLWYVLTLVLVLALFAVDILIVQQRIGIQRIDRELAATHTQLTNMLREELRELDGPRLAAEESLNVIATVAFWSGFSVTMGQCWRRGSMV